MFSASVLLTFCFSTAVQGLEIKLWPLIDYRSDETTGTSSLHLLGPLVSRERDPEGERFALRPVLLFQRNKESGANQLSLLYPLCIARWKADHWLVRAFGLFSLRGDRPGAPGGAGTRDVTLFPLIFYRHAPESSPSLSVLPLYSDLHGFFGYERTRMVLFPLYLELTEPLSRRTWAPFPFVGWSGGTLARGWRLWPLFGWQQTGNTSRFFYVAWPFYIRQELHEAQPEREVREVITPFYTRVDSTVRHSRTYGVFFTHTVDLETHTDSWGFPWPLWVRKTDLDSGQRMTLRLAPFYQDARRGSMRSRFYLWPLYRSRVVDEPGYFRSRVDFLLLVGRYIRELQDSPRSERVLTTFFPLWRYSEAERQSHLGLPALLDALLPHNASILSLYAPLWRLYDREGTRDGPPRWSLLWDLVSSDGERVHFPVHLALEGR